MPEAEQEFSLKKIFTPLSTLKAIHFLTILGFIVFGNMLFNQFVLDDIPVIVTNNNVHSLSRIPDNFLNPNNAKEVISYYRPVLFTFYALIYSAVQESTFLFHLIQLLFYIGNSILLFLIFRKYLRQGISLFLSLLFLVHPINQETAAYISNLQDVLFVFWGLIAMYILQRNSATTKSIIYVNVFLLLSLFSKESGILFFFVSLVYVYLFNKSKFFYHLLFSFVTVALYFLLRIASQVPFQKEAGIPIMDMTFWERMMQVPIIVFSYIKTFIFPKDLLVLQSWVITDINSNTFYLPLLFDVIFFALLLFLCIVIYKRSKDIKLIILFFSWFVLGFLLHLQIIPLDATVGNRYFIFHL